MSASPPLPDGVVECWFDYSSPFAYLATTQIERVALEAGATARFRPFLLGAHFQAIGTPTVPIATFSASKARHVRLDLARWASHWGVAFRFCTRFPLRTVEALRLTLLAPDPARPALVHALMRAAWVDDLDLTDRAVLEAALDEAGLDRALVGRTAEAREALFAAGRQAVALDLPGAPCFRVGDALFWGQDRLEFVGKALRGWRPEGVGSTPTVGPEVVAS